jgi:hypothetical protein
MKNIIREIFDTFIDNELTVVDWVFAISILIGVLISVFMILFTVLRWIIRIL